MDKENKNEEYQFARCNRFKVNISGGGQSIDYWVVNTFSELELTSDGEQILTVEIFDAFSDGITIFEKVNRWYESDTTIDISCSVLNEKLEKMYTVKYKGCLVQKSPKLPVLCYHDYEPMKLCISFIVGVRTVEYIERD